MHERRCLKQKPQPVEFIGRVASKRPNEASQFRLSFFLENLFRWQTEDKLAPVVGAQPDPVAIAERSGLGRPPVDEDAVALAKILNEEPRGACGNSHTLARDAHVVDGQVVTVLTASPDEERKLMNGNDL